MPPTSRPRARRSPASRAGVGIDLFALNEPQRRAVQHDAGPLLVLAGAGSGKTRVITYRIGRLLLDGVAPEEVLAVTFTNKAANEMRERLVALLGEPAQRVTLSTFHALGLKILKGEHALLGLPPHFAIYDAADQLSLMRELLRRNQVAERRLDAQRLLELTLACKKAGDLSPLLHNIPEEYATATRELYPRYTAQMRAFGAIDFDDLIGLSLEVLKRPDVAQRWQQRFVHLLVDEYQDTSPDQLALIQALAGKRPNVCVVGDDDQAIYAWRGAASDNILKFHHAFGSSTEIVLDQNYRSTGNILACANAVIGKNPARRDKKLWSALGNGERVVLTCCADEEDEAEYVADCVHKLQQEGFALGDIAVLYRSNAQSRILEQVLLAERIEHRVQGGQALFDRKEVRDAMAYLALALNSRDEVALRRVINVPPRGLGPAGVAQLSSWAAERNVPLYEALSQADVVDGLGPAGRRGARELIAALRQHGPKLREVHSAGEEAFEGLCQTLGLKDAILSANDTAGVASARLANLDAVTRSFGRFVTKQRNAQSGAPKEEGRRPGATLAEFLRAAALRGSSSEAAQHEESDGAALTLMSVHAAKGLEFPCVLFVGLEEDLLPHRRSIEDTGVTAATALAEERRLCYVGMTRARQRLFLSHAAQRLRHGRRVPVTPSRFLDDLPQDTAIVERRRRREDNPAERTAAHEQRAADFFAAMRAQLNIES